ncbi:MAG: family 20 glycosylhydrolase, partial [Clostridia bacterium]|nr:family 20 glycosylhydrolase [Clostridia bacterium]
AFFLFALEKSLGKEEIVIEQKPEFDDLGVMLAVQYPMKPQAVVSYMETMAALGFNYLLLYMETSYELKDYPFFGYVRGRYTQDELKYIDREGAKLGIEVIPCIQTFGHMQDYLRWPAAINVKDSAECLLADCEETYELIDAMVSAMRSAFNSSKIHIGFDETRGMGLGRYLKDHDYPDRIELFCRHLVRVKEICAKYGFTPMMWSDMPFRLGGDGHSQEYDDKSIIPPIVSEAASGVELCYWEYYQRDYESYDRTIKRHQELFKESSLIYSGAVWVRDNHIMNMPHTLATMTHSMKACIDNGVKNVNATIWGNSSDTNLSQSLPGLALFSEYCYTGRDCSIDDIYRVAEFATKLSRRYIEAISEIHLGFENSFKMGSRLILCDILYELMRYKLDYAWAEEKLTKALAIIKDEETSNTICPKEFAVKIFEIAILKCKILGGLRKSYKSGDREFLNKVANEYVNELIPLYERVEKLKTEIWMNTTKPFGVEKIQTQFAGIVIRLKFAQDRINDYLCGKIDRIEELEHEPLDEGYINWLGDTTHYMT